jgi:VWFA-related protein
MRISPEARRLIILSNTERNCVRHRLALFILCFILFLVCRGFVHAQDSPQAPAPSPAPQPEKPNSAEIASHDAPTTFKVNVKLVVVRAVVRDSQGHAVGNLQKEDFEVFDKGKPQVITQFDIEQPGALTAKARQQSEEDSGGVAAEKSSSAGNVPLAERFVAYLFDDVHLQFGDLAQVRKAAERHFATLKPTDRAAVFTTSGVTPLDFTDDRAKLNQALLRLQPRPLAGGFGQDCPDISYYQADLIVNKNDPLALQAAVQDALTCPAAVTVNIPGGQQISNATMMVNSISQQVLSTGEHESRVSLGVLKEVVRATSRMPGQRSVVVVSPGFITPQMEYEFTEIIDRAVRSQVVISTLDARGLYVPSTFADASRPRPPAANKILIETAADSAQADLLAVLADSTGGVFFHNSNDLDEGFRRVAETPEYSYVLAFVPQNLKLDGSFHTLKVKLKNPQKLTLQARRGYYAPKAFTSPDEQARQEIEDAMFSQEELHNLPVNLHTQFFKASDADAKLVVLAHVDVKRLHFRKVEGRNDNVLTCISGVFDRNGKFLQGIEKTVTMHWKDETLEHGLSTGMTLKTSFDVKPGSYLVRLVVRDSEGQLMSAENGTVEIR